MDEDNNFFFKSGKIWVHIRAFSPIFSEQKNSAIKALSTIGCFTSCVVYVVLREKIVCLFKISLHNTASLKRPIIVQLL